MKGIFHPLDDVSQADYRDALASYRRGEPLPPPSGKPLDALTPSERKAFELRNARWKRMTDEDARIDAALKELPVDPLRDDTVRAVVKAFQEAELPVSVTVGKNDVEIAAPDEDSAPLTRDSLHSRIQKGEAALSKERQPNGWSRFWAALRDGAIDSVEFKIPDIDLGLVKISPSKGLKTAVRSWAKSR